MAVVQGIGAYALVAGIILAATGGATAAPVCTELGCAWLVDEDGDDVPEGARVATGKTHYGLSAHVFRDHVFWQGDVTGDHHEETYPVLHHTGRVDLADHDGNASVHGVDARVELWKMYHDSGTGTHVVDVHVIAHDEHGYGWPHNVTANVHVNVTGPLDFVVHDDDHED